jgi:hypothetical protein
MPLWCHQARDNSSGHTESCSLYLLMAVFLQIVNHCLADYD